MAKGVLWVILYCPHGFLLNITFLIDCWNEFNYLNSACMLHDTAVCLKAHATIINCEVDRFSFPFQ